jgi:putative transposase
MSYWRNHVTKGWPDRNQLPIWQREYWDRQLRRRESYAAKWDYVKNNPVRHGLVTKAEDWPYQGELNSLAWHDP